jgi:methyl-accepting chemotaxis protein
VTKPVAGLVKTAHSIAQGDFGHELKIHRKDEIGQLAEAFRTMQHTIEQAAGETTRLIQAIRNGDLRARGQAEGFSGDWQTLVSGINELI